MATLQALRQAYKGFKSAPGFDRCLQHVNVISVEKGKLQCEVPVHKELLNMAGFLHGGFTATLIDSITTANLAASDPEKPVFGVSVDLHVSYLGKAKVGDTLSVTSEVIKRGKTLGFLKATITNQEGNVVATGLHTKFLKD